MQGTKDRRSGAQWGGFTLIELLVVIAIIALLIGILVPVLGKARLLGRSLKEQSAGHQQIIAYGSYVTDMRDATLVAAPHWAWNHVSGGYRVQYGMYPPDPWEKGKFMQGSITKTWPWHFVGATGYKHDLLQLDAPTYKDFFGRPSSPAGAGMYNDYTADTYAAAVGFHPSLGYNGAYVGGAYTHGAFRGISTCTNTGAHNGAHGFGEPTPAPNPQRCGGLFYLTKASDVKFPSVLLTFGSSRGGDVREGGWWSWGASQPNPPTLATMRPGYWMITAPRASPTERGGPTQFPGTQATATQLAGGWQRTGGVTAKANVFDPRSTAVSNWGNMDFRWQNKAVTAMFDGSVKMQGVEELDDMRKWSNYATSWDWAFRPY